MNKFYFRYSKLVIVLLVAVIILSGAGLVWNIYNIVHYALLDAMQTVVYSVITVLNAVVFGFALSITIYGRYVIKRDTIYCCFGLIKSKYKIAEIYQITHYRKQDKLVVFFADQKYTVIVISPAKYETFVERIREINSQIIFTVTDENLTQ